MGNSSSDLTVPDFSHIEKRRENGRERVLSEPLPPSLNRRSSNPIPAPDYEAPQLIAIPKQKGFMRSKSDGAIPEDKKQKGKLAATGFRPAKSAEDIMNSRDEIEPFVADDKVGDPEVQPALELDAKADGAGDGTIHESKIVNPTAPRVPNKGTPTKQPPSIPPIVTIDPSAPPAYEVAKAMSPLPKTQEAVDWVSQLKDLNNLHKEGALSEEEFQKAKDKLLANKPSAKNDEEDVREDFVE